jgi:cation:H+ antiporter
MDTVIGESFVLILLLAVVGKSAAWAVRAAIALSRIAGLPELVVSFLVVTAISILPETIISVISALQGLPSLGLGTLLGSNVADLAFVFGAVALLAKKELRVEATFIKKDYLFLSFLILPLALGFTGHFSRFDGYLLIAAALLFFFLMSRVDPSGHKRQNHIAPLSLLKELAILSGSLLLLGGAGYYTVQYAAGIAQGFGITPALVGLLIVALGTTLPELIFSVRAARHAHASLALGDILGTVIADATLVLGITAAIHPFAFNPRLIIVTGIFMLLAGLFTFHLLRSGRVLTKLEGGLLLFFYALFIMVEFILRDWTPLVGK